MLREQRHRLAHKLARTRTMLSAMLRICGSKLFISNSMMALAVFCIWSMASSMRRDQILDVAAIEGRDEGAAHRDQHIAGDGVGFLLVAHDRAIVVRYRFPAIEHASQGLRRRGD